MIDNPDPFFQIPNKIFNLGLNASELAVFIAILSHRGKNSAGMFPSTIRLAEMTSQGRTSIDKAIRTLRACNVVQWQRGKAGRANTYVMLGTGAWIHKTQAILTPPRKRTKAGLPPAQGYAHLSHTDSKSHVTQRHRKRGVDVTESHTHPPYTPEQCLSVTGYVRHANNGYDLDAHIPQREPENGDNSTPDVDKSQTDVTDRHGYVRHANTHCSPHEHASVRHTNTNHTHLNQIHRTIPEESIFQSLLEKIRKKAEH